MFFLRLGAETGVLKSLNWPKETLFNQDRKPKTSSKNSDHEPKIEVYKQTTLEGSQHDWEWPRVDMVALWEKQRLQDRNSVRFSCCFDYSRTLLYLFLKCLVKNMQRDKAAE